MKLAIYDCHSGACQTTQKLTLKHKKGLRSFVNLFTVKKTHLLNGHML